MAHKMSIPIRLECLKIPAKWEFRTLKKNFLYAFPTVIEASHTRGANLLELDAWACRDKFFKIREGNQEELAEFLSFVGVWSNDEILAHSDPEFSRHHCINKNPIAISVDGLWRFRAGLKRALLNRKEFVEEYAPSLPLPETEAGFVIQRRYTDTFPLRFEVSGGTPWGVLGTTEASRMLLATIYVDGVRKIRFKVCAREDCLAPFPLKTKHARKFCTQYCGHLVSQRKTRASKQTKQKSSR